MRDYKLTHYPPDTMEVCQENLDLFFHFIYDRHMIWYNRYVLKLPQEKWTNDPILKITKYTNSFRELDRGTLWWLDNIGEEYLKNKIQFNPGDEYVKQLEKDLQIDSSISKTYLVRSDDNKFKKLLWQTVIYRLCNRIETIEEVEIPDLTKYDSDIKIEDNEFCKKLTAISARGQPVMTSAHLTCPTPAGYSKVEGFILAVNSLHKNLDLVVREIETATKPQDVFDALRLVHCVGNFIAYEVWCDLTYVKAIPFTLDDWANVGPGANEGIRLIYPSTKGKRAVYMRMVQLRDEQHDHFKRLNIDFPFYEKFTKGHLSLRSVEHQLCEFSKFWLQKHNLGKQRLKFTPNDNRIVEKDGKKYRIVVTTDGEHVERVYLS